MPLCIDDVIVQLESPEGVRDSGIGLIFHRFGDRLGGRCLRRIQRQVDNRIVAVNIRRPGYDLGGLGGFRLR